MGTKFLVPHFFTYIGRDGIGNYQDQEEFKDEAGQNRFWSVALGSRR